MTNLVRFAPGRELNKMQTEIDRIFNDFFPGRTYRLEREGLSTWTPRVDLSETEDGYIFSFDLPGINKKDITINFQDGVLTVSGERQFEEKKEEENYIRLERSRGEFSRAFNIPHAIQTDKIQANYKDGVLNIALLKAEEVKPIKVKVA